MQDVLSFLANLERPSLLVKAARIGAADYNRTQHLRRLLKQQRPPRSADALLRLSELEAEANDRRLTQDTAYSIPRHVDLLIAIIAEAKLLRQSTEQITLSTQGTPQPQMNASGSASLRIAT
jgi:hypothetical protein